MFIGFVARASVCASVLVCVTATLVSLKSELVVGTINRHQVMQAEKKTLPRGQTRTNFLFIFSSWTAAAAAAAPPADAQDKPLATIFVSKWLFRWAVSHPCLK